MAQHLAKSPVPFCNKSICELGDLRSRRSMPRPHCRLQGLVSCVVGDELTNSVRKAPILPRKWQFTQSVSCSRPTSTSSMNDCLQDPSRHVSLLHLGNLNYCVIVVRFVLLLTRIFIVAYLNG